MISYLHFCDGCGKPIIDFEIRDTNKGDKIVDAYCPKCQKKEPLTELLCKLIAQHNFMKTPKQKAIEYLNKALNKRRKSNPMTATYDFRQDIERALDIAISQTRKEDYDEEEDVNKQR